MFSAKDLKRFRVAPGSTVNLAKYQTDWAGSKGSKDLRKSEHKRRARALLEKNTEDLSQMQELVYASNSVSILIVLQAMDAAGKDGTIRHVMTGINPQGCQVFSFKHPSAEELDHNFLWRYARDLPERGRIGIFNRSYYEDVLVLKVHPERVNPHLPVSDRGAAFWKARYDDIVAFERHLTRNGTHILKFFLHLSKEEQRQRFLDRLTNPEKQWKYSSADLRERKYWDDYQRVYAEAMTATSTAFAPWYVIPADRKYMARAIISEIMVKSVRGLGLTYPAVRKDEQKALVEARDALEAEGRQLKGKGSKKKKKSKSRKRG